MVSSLMKCQTQTFVRFKEKLCFGTRVKVVALSQPDNCLPKNIFLIRNLMETEWGRVGVWVGSGNRQKGFLGSVTPALKSSRLLL